MELYWKAAAGVMLAVVLCMTLSRHERDIGLLLSIGVCCMVSGIAMHYLEPVLDLLRQLEAAGDLQDESVTILMKCLGIGIVSQIAGSVCNDAGNSSMGKTMQFLGNIVILYLSVPVFSTLLSLIQEILGDL